MLNPNKICFISCVNNLYLYEETLQYIKALEIPKGMEVELINIQNAGCMAEGYNDAIKKSDAKYKVYMHQDVFIINQCFITECVKLFSMNSDIGMLGMVGAKVVPPNGLWWESESKVGSVYESRSGKMQLLSYGEGDTAYESVQCIDGFLMVTQYDLPWRSDLFTDWHFYDISQSVEFHKKGYKVVVPLQKEPWSMHDCGEIPVNTALNESSRRIFLEEYSPYLYPLVSVLIPTYNRPYYFELALRSVLQQSYKNIEIVICDDSTNNETKGVYLSYKDKHPNIKYFKNEENLGQFLNDIKCVEMSTGEYINFLMDDDLFHPRKIERMMAYFLGKEGNQLSLVTSHRQLIDDDGNHLEDIVSTQRLFNEDTMLDGIEFGSSVLPFPENFIGEPTTVLFKKNDLNEPFGTLKDRAYVCNVDMASWITLLSKGSIVYISETLSYFRLHKGQQLQSKKMRIGGAVDYSHQVLISRSMGFLKSQDQYENALNNSIKYVKTILQDTLLEEDDSVPLIKHHQMLLDELTHLIKNKNGKAPLVSILIPSYNRPHYLELAIKSALAQTYPNIEIIISDDSTNDQVETMIQPYLVKYKHIHYYKNKVNLNLANGQRCLDLANGDYINFLMDDDLFHPLKIEKMVQYLNDEEISMVTSYRAMIDDTGHLLPDIGANRRLFAEDTIIDGFELGNHVLTSLINVVGEPTTVMFRKNDIKRFGIIQDWEYFMINDLATWIFLLSKGKAAYLSEPLSYFRRHEGQNQRNPKFLIRAIADYKNIIKEARMLGFLNDDEKYYTALERCMIVAMEIIKQYRDWGLVDALKEYDVIQTCTSVIEELIAFQYKDV